MMNILLDAWATTMWRACWQGGLVVLLVWVICRLIPSMSPRFQCWFWRLAILKFTMVLVVPWSLNVPLLPAPRVPERDVEVTSLHPTIEIHQDHLTKTAVLPRRMPLFPAVLFLVWIIGMGGSLIRLLTAWRDSRRLLRESYPIKDISLSEHLVRHALTFGIRRLPELRAVPGLGSPMLVGVYRPVVLLPATTLGRLDSSERIMVLGHELAHIMRGDLLWSIVATVVRAVFFFHPLAWLNQRRLNLLQEIAADELAIAQQQHDPVSYGKLLVAVVEKFGPSRLLPRMSMGTAGPVKSLSQRLVAMTRIGRTSRRVIVGAGTLLGVVVLLGIVPWRLVAAESTQSRLKPIYNVKCRLIDANGSVVVAPTVNLKDGQEGSISDHSTTPFVIAVTTVKNVAQPYIVVLNEGTLIHVTVVSVAGQRPSGATLDVTVEQSKIGDVGTKTVGDATVQIPHIVFQKKRVFDFVKYGEIMTIPMGNKSALGTEPRIELILGPPGDD